MEKNYYSKPVNYLFTQREPAEIRYRLDVHKSGILKRKRKAEIIIKVPDIGIPNLVVVKQKGRLPNRKSDGEIIQRIAMTESKEELTFDLSDAIEEDTYVKLFFEEKEDARNFKIVLEPGAKSLLYA